jgi:phosphopantetheine adenylyltransferase
MLRATVGATASVGGVRRLLAEYAGNRGRERRGAASGRQRLHYEFQMALMNRQLHPSLETVFLVPALDLTY